MKRRVKSVKKWKWKLEEEEEEAKGEQKGG